MKFEEAVGVFQCVNGNFVLEITSIQFISIDKKSCSFPSTLYSNCYKIEWSH